MNLHILLNVLLMAALVWFEIVYAVDLATHALTPVRRVPHVTPRIL
jgi:hypothetical protein